MHSRCGLLLIVFLPGSQPTQNNTLATYRWPVIGKPRALMFISHGYGEHVSPYFDGLGQACGAGGLLCWGHDHIGHGNSPGGRTEVKSMQEYTIPVLAACKRMRREHPHLPLFLMGHSLGGLIAFTAALTDPTLFDGLLLTGPLLHSGDDNPMNRAIASVASKMCPTCSFPFLKIDIEKVANSKAWQRYIENDPIFYHGGYKFGPSQVVIKGFDWAVQHLEDLRMPFLILHGLQDQLSLLSGSRELIKRSKSRDKQLIIFQDSSHHVLLDSPALAEKTLVDWVISRIPNSQ